MKIENIEVYGWHAAFRGMRNPMDSWDKSDSAFGVIYPPEDKKKQFWQNPYEDMWVPEYPIIGPADLKLAKKLIKGGSEHRKFLRQIMIWADFTLPIYIWSELDTYKVSTVRNSCSTMHTLGLRDLEAEDFQGPIMERHLDFLNMYGQQFRQAKVMKDTVRMNLIRHEYKNALPSGFLQKATYSMNYETALNMYFQRRNHRLPEWNEKEPGSICSFLKSLPYMSEFIDAKF